MKSYVQCASCRCLLKTIERRCPFCGAAVIGATEASRRPVRMSRSAWLALGSSVAAIGGATAHLGCQSPATGDVGTVADASSDGQGDALSANDDPAWMIFDAGAQTCAVEPRKFHCGSAEAGIECDSANEYCAATSTQYQCSVPDVSAECRPIGADFDYPRECVSCASCACVGKHLPSGTPGEYAGEGWGCDDSNGGVVITHGFWSCGPCYGAPPARLERLERLERLDA